MTNLYKSFGLSKEKATEITDFVQKVCRENKKVSDVADEIYKKFTDKNEKILALIYLGFLMKVEHNQILVSS